jgi:hypothetical protein
MRSSMRWNETLLGLALAALLTLGSAAHAQVISGTATASVCLTLSGTAKNCTDKGFLNKTPVGANSDFIGAPEVGGSTTPATFTSAFDAWDAADGDVWTLVNGGGVDVSISAVIGVSASADGAGLNPVLFTLTAPPGGQQILDNLVWTQALVINYSPLKGSLARPEQTLDTFDFSQNAAGSNPKFPKSCVAASSGASPKNGAFCGPIYPFQYAAELANDKIDGVPMGVDPFYDAPEGDWPNASFDAVTLLSTVSQATHTLTVYQGVSYGFSLSVPELSSRALVLIGLPALALARRPRGGAIVAKRTSTTL